MQAHLYRGETMLVLRRTKEMLATLAATDALALDKTPDPDYVDPEYIDRGENRGINPEFLVVRGVCTHLGCVPVLRGADGKRTVGTGGQAGSSARAINPATTTRAASCAGLRRATFRCRRIVSRAQRES